MENMVLKLHVVARNMAIVSALIIAGSVAVSGMVNIPVYAADDSLSAENCDPEGKNSSNFLNFPTWYRGLSCDSSGILSLRNNSPGIIALTVGLNAIDIMLRLIAMVAIVFLVWGGIQYMLSSGDSAKSAKAQKTVTGAIVGLMIAIVSVSIVTFVVKGISSK